MKRYKQVILSNFFVAIHEAASYAACQNNSHHHLVEANLDIEARGDRTLCTEVLQGAYRYEVLTNHLFVDACPICSAILSRRISNMPIERRTAATSIEKMEEEVPESQMTLGLVSWEDRQETMESEAAEQFELFF